MKRIVVTTLLILVVIIGAFFLNSSKFFSDVGLNGSEYHGAEITIIGNCVFYSNMESAGASSLKARNIETGNEITVSSVPARRIFLQNDRLFYLSAKSFAPVFHVVSKSLNGFWAEKVNNVPADGLLVEGDTLYYRILAYGEMSGAEENGNIFKLDLKTNKEEKLLSHRVAQYEVYGDHLYFTILCDYETFKQYNKEVYEGIYKCSLQDGNEQEIVSDKVGEFFIENGNLFYSKLIVDKNSPETKVTYNLVRVNLESSESETLASDIVSFRVFDETVCYINTRAKNAVEVLNLSTNERKKVQAKGINSDRDFVVHNGKLYYYDDDDTFCELAI